MGQHFPSLDVLIKLADVLNIELKDFFEFAHETKSSKELKEALNGLFKEADEEKLRLLIKVVRAIIR